MVAAAGLGLLSPLAECKEGRVTDAPCVTSDYLPTVMDVLGETYDERPLDGESILPLIQGRPFARKKPIGFKSRNRFAWNAGQYKLYIWERGVRESFEGKEYGRESYNRLKQRWPGAGFKQLSKDTE